MIIHKLKQGTPEWHEFRAHHHNASEAAAMLGQSPYQTRNELLREKAIGIRAAVDNYSQQLFDNGHRFEALARPLAEEIIGAELYPGIGSHEYHTTMAASFDGLTFLGDIVYEHKMLNDAIRKYKDATELSVLYRAQMEQQLLVSGAEKVLFVATAWNENDELTEKKVFWYFPDMELRKRLIDGWTQFAIDLFDFKYEEPSVEVIGRSPEMLPALLIEVRGEVTASNLAEFNDFALSVLDGIKTELTTDEDFANADKTTKWCKEVETRLEGAKQHALAQTQSIDDLFRTIDKICEQTRHKRLTLEKLVKQQKENIRAQNILATQRMYAEYLKSLGITELNQDYSIRLDFPKPDFGGAIKGLKSLISILNALDTMLAQEKINASNRVQDIRSKLNIYEQEGKAHAYLFPDLGEMLKKPVDDFLVTIKHRISMAKEKERFHAMNQPPAIQPAPIPQSGGHPINEASQSFYSAGETIMGIPQNSCNFNYPSFDVKHQSILDNPVEEFMKTRDYGENTELVQRILMDFYGFLGYVFDKSFGHLIK